MSVTFRGWAKGMNNRGRDYDVPDDALRSAINVNVYTSGKIEMRYGPRQVNADANAHSLFQDGRRLYWATPTTLKAAQPGLTPVTLLTSALLAKPLSWVRVNGELYFSNEDVNGMVNSQGLYEPWGIVPPLVPPTLSAAFGIRTVMVTCTFVAARIALDGTAILEESAAPIAASVACGDSPAILVTNIPQSSDARVVATRLYVSGVDGTEMYREVDVPAGVTTWTIRGDFGTGKVLRTQFDDNPMPGQILEHHNGVVFIAAGNVLYHTKPIEYHLIDNDAAFFMFPERITMVLRVPDGIFVSADRTYFMPDVATDGVKLKTVLEYRAIEGAAMHLPESDEVAWLSERGFVLGNTGGAVKNLTEGQIAMESFTRASLGLFERDGHRALIAVGQSSTPTPLLSRDWIADEALRVSETQ